MPATRLKKFYAFDTSRFFPCESVELRVCLACGLRMFFNALPGDADFYDAIQGLRHYYETDKPEFEHALERIRAANARAVLEVGAGCGHFLKKLIGIPAMRVKASELSNRCLAALKVSGIDLDHPADLYDFICSFQVLEHVADLRAWLDYCNAKLQPGGHLLICVPNPECELFSAGFVYLDYPPHHVNRFTKLALESLGRVLNYETVEYWHEPLRIEHFSAIVKARRESLLADARMPWLRRRLGSLIDSVLLPATSCFKGEVGHSHTMVFRKPVC